MKHTNFSEFRKHAAEFLNQVEKGETVRIFRYGKPVADLSSVVREHTPSWKQAPPRISLHGASLSKTILRNRREALR